MNMFVSFKPAFVGSLRSAVFISAQTCIAVFTKNCLITIGDCFSESTEFFACTTLVIIIVILL